MLSFNPRLTGRSLQMAGLRSLPILFAAMLAACADGDRPLEAVEWLKLGDAHCETNGGEMLAVRNKDAERTLVIWLDRWFMGVKTADRGHHELAPGDAPLQLGCSATDGGEQHWELVDSKFTHR